MSTKKKIFDKNSIFFKKIDKLKKNNPTLTVLLMHEYYKALWPYDYDLKFKELEPYKRVDNTIDELINILDNANIFSFYQSNKKQNKNPDIGTLYFELFKKFTKKNNIDTKKFFIKRFQNIKNMSANKFVFNQNILDAGCGHGRYSYAMSKMGAKFVTGADYEKKLLNLAKKTFKNKNLRFKHENVLKFTFKDNSFDRVFCNGVLHHTGNLNRGLSEVIRVCKKGGYVWIFLYGNGGIFWEARKKMRQIMKHIPFDLAKSVLENINTPPNKLYFFLDNWYVKHEDFPVFKKVEKHLYSLGVENVERVFTNRVTDLEYGARKYKNGEIIWGEGEIRILIKK